MAGLAGWLCSGVLLAQTAAKDPGPIRGELVTVENQVELLPRGASRWVKASAGEKLYDQDSVRTGPNSRAMIRLRDRGEQSILRLGADSQITFQSKPPVEEKEKKGLFLFRGIMSFFHRDEPKNVGVETPSSTLAVKGTEFVVQVLEEPNGVRTVLYVVDGQVEMANAQDAILVTNREQAEAVLGRAPQLIPAGFVVNTILQWALYYPAVLNPEDLHLTAQENQALSDSLRAYREGNVLQALQLFPDNRPNPSPDENIYHAALLLSVGQIAQAESLLAGASSRAGEDGTSRIRQLIDGLHTLIAAVTVRPERPAMDATPLPTQWLAASYWEQSRSTGDEALRRALAVAKAAATNAPGFGFAWARVAELEFSFGRTRPALDNLAKSLELNPANAQAMTLQGFLLAAQFHILEAKDWFEKAIAIDPGLGNAWLGRGLCRIRLGAPVLGREDLLVAAALEPQRALPRSYLGKAFAEAGDLERAGYELDLAKSLDPADPTPWLYGALLDRESLRINQSIRELEHSIDLNDNKALYRSRMLLDQDRAVRSSSLATLYQSANMDEVAVREAATAVGYDYANYSAHLFLSDSYNALRDPTRFNLRYETPWFNELLLANLLSPVGGTPLSQNISQQEYARLFERNRIGLSSATEYRSDGQVRELASQYGRVGQTSWALDLDYEHNNGVRANNELDRLEWYTTLKQQLTPQDSVLFLAKYQDYDSGDNFQRYNQNNSSRTFKFEDDQHPLLALGYHHEWRPGVHTLLLGSRLDSQQHSRELGVNSLILATNAAGDVTQVYTVGTGLAGNDIGGIDYFYDSQFETYSGELNQIVQQGRHTVVVGSRVQRGNFDTDNLLVNVQPPAQGTLFQNPPASASIDADFERDSFYGYYTLEPIDHLLLTAGLAYDRVVVPSNHRNPPVSSGEDEEDQWDPKAGVIWNPLPALTMRGVYTRSLGGVSFDESFRLEPTQVAGFNQSFRTIISESIVGSVSAPSYETMGGALDYKLKSNTYLGVQGQHLDSRVHRTIGIFGFDDSFNPQSVVPITTREHLDYGESSISAYVNQLLAEEWVLGTQYRFTHSKLHTELPSIPASLNLNPSSDRTEKADLHQVNLFLLYNHPSGLFARAETQWYHQNNAGYQPSLATEDFFQHNVYMGYRLRRQRGEIGVGILNLADTDYRLNPLNLYAELPRERVFVARLKFNF